MTQSVNDSTADLCKNNNKRAKAFAKAKWMSLIFASYSMAI